LINKSGPKPFVLFLENEEKWKENFGFELSMAMEVWLKTWNLIFFLLKT